MIPGSPEWSRVMTASKVAAVLGLSPWESPRTMWHKMRGELPTDDGSNAAAKSRGHYLEAGICAWWRDLRQPESAVEQATYTDGAWAAATPDLAGVDAQGNQYVMDAKTAATDDDWGTPGTDEAPAYYVAQSMWQMYVSGATVAYIAVLFGRPQLAFKEYVIERDDDLVDAIAEQCRAFYDSLTDDDAAPTLSDMPCEYDTVRRVHADIDKGDTATIPADLAAEFTTAYHSEKSLPAIKARVLEAMGRAQYATDPAGQLIARRQKSGEAVALYCTAPKPALERTAS